MGVHYAAVQEKNTWRKHSGHESLATATTGPDGAENLLRGHGRVGREMRKKYGHVFAVFLWEDDKETAVALRLVPGSATDIERTQLPVELLAQFNKRHGPSLKQIDDWFAHRLPSPGQWYPDEIPEGAHYYEGSVTQVLVNAYERSAAARQACIDYYGPICKVCDLNFEDHYGAIGRGFIHVHHEVNIASIGTNYQVDPIRSLKPVCPNCHAMLHRQEPPLLIDALRTMLKR
jgi:hypothetical protein